MPISSAIIDAELPALTHDVDHRWLMAFAAGVGDARPELIDTARPGGIIAHPLFAIALEWPSYVQLSRAMVANGLDPDQRLIATPVDYDLALSRVVRSDEQLTVRTRVIAVRLRRDGVLLTVQSHTSDDTGAAVARSTARILFPGIELVGKDATRKADGADGVIDLRAEWANPDAVIRRGHRRVGASAAHVFSACSGVWNPVHTDRAIALDHGLPGVTMPQAGVMAMAVGGALQLASAEPGWVRRVRARFGAPVPVPSGLEIEAEVPNHPSTEAPIRFRANLDDGTPVITSGVMVAVPADDEAAAVARRIADRRTRLGLRSMRIREPL